jgi:cellulose synthase/poly-beta-1,6-N-acetylglucosamine synthase-like glycosyltransferase
MVVLIINWNRIPVLQLHTDHEELVTVLIPVRNEERYIERLINSIQNCKANFPFEIIVIDDHSTDFTKDKVKDLKLVYDNLFLTDLSDKEEGKKAGITKGVSLASGKLIVCTDGDSEVREDWLNYHVQAYCNGAKLSFGSVVYRNANHSLVIEMLNVELHSLVATGGATLQMQKPTMINGCNYSFAKKAFEDVNGFEGNEKIPSGDDEFLLRKIFARYPSDITFLKSTQVEVITQSPENMSQFVNQRIRWASKWRFHKDTASKILPLGLFVGYASVIWCIYHFFIESTWLIGGLLLSKLFIDALFLLNVYRERKEKLSLIGFLILQFTYPFYVVYFGIAANFGSYQWRNRKYNI